jgi:hypothetical protein
MPARVPPPEIPVISWLSPNKADQGLLEFWNTEVASYVPLDVGAPHPVQRLYPGFRLGKQAPVQGDEKWVLRTWISDETSPDWFNWALKYSGEDNAFPIFIRTYREPRATYTPRVKGTALGTLYKTVMTNVGSGYANGSYPTVEFDVPTTEATEVAIGHGVVSADGSITEVVLDFGGEGYAQDVEFRVFPPITGDQATGIAYVQPQIAILVREEASLYPPDSEFYAQYLQVTRVYETIPGPTFVSQKPDEDGMLITVSTTRKLCSDITPGEPPITGGMWCKTSSQPTDIDVICEEVVQCRPVPGNPMVDSKPDKDGKQLAVVKTLKDTTTITVQEVISSGFWVKTSKQAVSDLVAYEFVEARAIPGNIIPSASVNGDQEIRDISTVLRDESLITPSSTESGGFITTVEKDAVSDLVANQITTVTQWLDKAFYSQKIPDSVIPVEFRAAIPTTTESHVLAGTASAAGATLTGSQIFVSEKQLTKNLYEHRTEDFGSIGFPIIQTNYETTEEYGGGILQVIRTLNDSVLTVDEGESVVRSEVHEIGQSYLWFKETASRFGAAAWPILLGTEVDPRTGIAITVIKQVVNAGTLGGISGSDYIDVKTIDKWRSIQITSRLDPDSLPGTVTWKTTDTYPFPNTLVAATWLWALATDDCCYDFAMALETEILEGYSGPCVAQITESFTNGPPLDTPVLTQFFPQGYSLGYAWAVTSPDEDCRLCQAVAQTIAIPSTIHAEITIAGGVILDNGTFTSTLPATTPTALPAPGTLITKSVDVERWRFGVFFRRVTEIYVP